MYCVMRWLSLLVLLVALPLQAATTQVRLLLPTDAAAPGQTLLAGVRLKMAPMWHTYWRNAGDAGAPTEIEWSLPAGITAGEIQWPIPEKIKFGDLLTYGYHDEVVLLVPLSVAPDAAPGPRELKAEVSWLECEVQCVKGRGDVAAKLTVGPGGKPTTEAAVIESWKGKLPKSGSDMAAKAAWAGAAEGDSRPLQIEWPPRNAKATYDFYPYAGKGFEVAAKTEASSAGGKARLKKAVTKYEGDWPAEISGLLVEQTGKESVVAYEVKMPFGTAVPVTTAASVAGAKAQSLWAMLGFAFLGGLILNIMPCVLPVIALKILGFVQQSKEAPGRVRSLGIVYTLGVLASFLVLAGLVIAVQKAGRAASWGMQFQNPVFVIVMTTLVTLVALNLFGLFEVNLGGSAMGAAGDLASKEGATGAFFNGVLATALATPCTAPFLAVALGFAFAQPARVICLMFLVMGFGLAAPYLVLSWFPQWLRVLPKPGAWMEKFKIAMGFPMLATALWLLSLTNAHFGSSGPLWVGLFLVVLALAVWIWGQFVQRGGSRRGIALALSVVLIAGAYTFALERELNWRNPAPPTANGVHVRKGGIPWEAWSPQAVADARGAGRVVLVDFTADWCVTCQANKKSSLEISSVRQKLKDLNAVALLGDYTREDPRIAEELKRYQRAGVPLVLVYPTDKSAEPIVLPSLLTPGIVLDALEKAAGKQTAAVR
jgi:thiol:disulfide interchange protein DsbD